MALVSEVVTDLTTRTVVSPAITVNVPEWFRDTRFLSWLNSDWPKFTWHRQGHGPDEWSDVVVLVDPSLNGEGSEGGAGEFPQDIWDQIICLCAAVGVGNGDAHISVRITNLDI